MVIVAGGASAVEMGEVTGTVNLLREGTKVSDASGVVVYLEAPSPLNTATPERHPEVRQRELAFTPDLLVVQRGTTIDFPNEDKVFHNVFSLSDPSKFDLGLYKSGSSKSVTFSRAGVVDLFCNIHPQMIAKILVVDSPYFARVRPDGTFRIPDVVVGEYPLVVWQRYGQPYRGQVKVKAHGPTSLALELTEGTKPRSHLRKDGTPYGRYK